MPPFPGLRAEDWVTVKAWAQPDYALKRAAHPEKAVPYVVAKGEYFAGITNDPSIEKAQFTDIVNKLALDLAKQKYMPVKTLKEADELIVVHWGTTIPYVSDYEMSGQDNPNYYDPHPEDFASGYADMSSADSQAYQAQMRALYTNEELSHVATEHDLDMAAHMMTSNSISGLLGYTSELSRMEQSTYASEEEKMLLTNLSEERYFIILVSFDLHDLIENHHRRILWTAHMSTRAPGSNFDEAVVKMSQIAAVSYGQSFDRIQNQRAVLNLPPGNVKIGPIRILGMQDAPVASK